MRAPAEDAGSTLLVGELPRRARAPADAIRIATRALPRVELARYRTVVLLDEALRTLDPLALHAHDVRVLLCPDQLPCHRLAKWLAAGYVAVIAPDEISHLDGAAPRRVARWTKPLLEPNAWWVRPVARHSRAERALAEVPRLRRATSVSEWASRLGLTRQGLWVLCAREAAIGAKPRDVLSRHVLVQARVAREAGIPLRAVAAGLGLSDASSLCRIRRQAVDRLRMRS